MKWSEYVNLHKGGRTQVEIAGLIGVDQTTVSRWIRGKGGPPDAENAINFARAVHQPPLHALLAAGILSEGEVGEVVRIERSLEDFSDDELVNVLRQRLVELRVERRRGA